MIESSIDRLDAFRASLDDAGVTHERVGVDDATDAIARAVELPAVGVELSVDAALPEGVATDFAPADLQAARTGITPARLGVAATGSVLVRSAPEGDELVSLYPERHVAVLAASDVVPDIPAATNWLDDEVGVALDDDGDDPHANATGAGRDSYVFATGVSATADMGALVEGVHGPTEVHVVIVQS